MTTVTRQQEQTPRTIITIAAVPIPWEAFFSTSESSASARRRRRRGRSPSSAATSASSSSWSAVDRFEPFTSAPASTRPAEGDGAEDLFGSSAIASADADSPGGTTVFSLHLGHWIVLPACSSPTRSLVLHPGQSNMIMASSCGSWYARVGDIVYLWLVGAAIELLQVDIPAIAPRLAGEMSNRTCRNRHSAQGSGTTSIGPVAPLEIEFPFCPEAGFECLGPGN